MTRSMVCVDASLVVALLIPERFTSHVMASWRRWVIDDWQVIAPMLISYEVTSALYRKTLQGLISSADSRAALQQFLALDIQKIDTPNMPLRATQLAEELMRPNTYDMYYLALAEEMNCPFWTADERLYNTARKHFPLVHWTGVQPANT